MEFGGVDFDPLGWDDLVGDPTLPEGGFPDGRGSYGDPILVEGISVTANADRPVGDAGGLQRDAEAGETLSEPIDDPGDSPTGGGVLGGIGALEVLLALAGGVLLWLWWS